MDFRPTYYDATRIGDDFERRGIAAFEPDGPLSDAEFASILSAVRRQRQEKAMRAYRLWRGDLLPADVVVIEVPIERTGYGDVRFNLPDYGPPKVMVADEDRNPAPDDRIKVIEVELHRCIDPVTGAALVLGWNERPPRLIVGHE